MVLRCPKCCEMLDVSPEISETAKCPSCGEEIEVDVLRRSICPICGCGFEEADTINVCPGCKTPHHEECWTENQGCSTYGCAFATHQETHTTEGVSAGAENNTSMVPCPACGALHPATDLVCVSCGKLFGNDSLGDSTGARLKESVFWIGSEAKTDLWPRLARNFRLLGQDIANVFRLWWGEFSRYVQFSGKTKRREYIAFCGVNTAVTLLFSISGAAPLVLLDQLAVFLPTLASTVRRLRDTDVSPWLIFAFPVLPFLLLVPSVASEGMTKDTKENA